MSQKPRSTPNSQQSSGRPFTAMDVRLMLSSPVYAYGINLLPAERVAEEVMKLNTQLAQQVRKTGATFTLDDLDQRVQAMRHRLEDYGVCCRGEAGPPISTLEKWLQTQSIASLTLSGVSRG